MKIKPPLWFKHLVERVRCYVRKVFGQVTLPWDPPDEGVVSSVDAYKERVKVAENFRTQSSPSRRDPPRRNAEYISAAAAEMVQKERVFFDRAWAEEYARLGVSSREEYLAMMSPWGDDFDVVWDAEKAREKKA